MLSVAGSPRRGRVPAGGPGRGGAALGPAQAEAQHELRQAVARAAVLLRQEYHEQGTAASKTIPTGANKAGFISIFI